MPIERLGQDLAEQVAQLKTAGTAKGAESVVVFVRPPTASSGARFQLAGEGNREFIRMNSNSYLGLGFDPEMNAAEEAGARDFGVGPGAVRFISGTCKPHVDLEARLAAFHGRPACMITSSAYTSVMGVISCLATPETVIISDELNHNCIINAMKLARPKSKKVYPHLDLKALETALREAVAEAQSVLVVTDGVFSMRGDLAPLKEICDLVKRYDEKVSGNVVLIVDDSHGVGALGATGRGTEEVMGVAGRVDILIGTLGKAFAVNGGYVVTSREIVDFLREKNPFYIYTNPITPSEATSAIKALDIVESEKGKARLKHLRDMTAKFETGIKRLGFETISSPHPVVPLLTRDTEKNKRLVAHLRRAGVLATGLNYPVVPAGEQLIRFQVCADHTASDIETVLSVLERFPR